MEIDLGKDSTPTTLKGDYILSKDGTTLYTWLNKELNSIDMQADPELSKVTTIGAYANDSILSQIKLPNGLKKIGNNTFENSGLTSITIPNGVKVIATTAFKNNQLTSVIIPNSVKSIGASAFSNTELTSVRVEAITPPNLIQGNYYYSWEVFGYSPNLTISVPQ